MTEKNYQDAVNRTFKVYGSKLVEALNRARKENPNFGRYEVSPGVYSEVQVGKNGITNISPKDLKYLEGKLQEVTGDSSARLLRTLTEYIKEMGRLLGRTESSVAEIATYKIEDEFMDRSEYLDKKFRKKSLRDKL